MVPGKNLIIIDGENFIDNFDSDILKFIEAHEISHVILGHDGPRNEEEELDADLGAYLLLKKFNKKEALKHLLDHFEDRDFPNPATQFLDLSSNQLLSL